MRDVLVPRKQTRPLGGKAKKPDDMDDDDSEELDALIMSTIRLHLADNVYVTVLDNKKMSKKFGKSYAIHMRRKLQQTKCFFMRKLYDLRIKDNDIVTFQLNEFDALWSHLQSQMMTMANELK